MSFHFYIKLANYILNLLITKHLDFFILFFSCFLLIFCSLYGFLVSVPLDLFCYYFSNLWIDVSFYFHFLFFKIGTNIALAEFGEKVFFFCFHLFIVGFVSLSFLVLVLFYYDHGYLYHVYFLEFIKI